MAISSKSLQVIFDYLMITLGSLITAIGLGVFLIEANVVPGGVTGLSMAITFVWDGIPVGLLIILLNIPLFIWGIFELGNAFGVRTFYGFVSNSLFIDFFRGDFFRGEIFEGLPIFHGWALQKTETIQYLMKHDFFFFMAIGTVLVGIGLGLIFKFKGTTAGTEIICAILKKRLGLKPGMTMLVVDCLVIALATVVLFINPKSEIPVIVLTMYAIASLYFQSMIMDQVIYGFDYAKEMWIMSNKNEEISQFIMKELDRGVTAFKARGVYTNREREALMTVVSSSDARMLGPRIREIDPSAFIVVCNVNEVLGEGFRTREEVDLKFINALRQQEALKEAADAAQQAIRAELAAEQLNEKANEARLHAQKLLESDSDCSKKITQEAHENAAHAEADAREAIQKATEAREHAKKLEEVASSIEECIHIANY